MEYARIYVGRERTARSRSKCMLVRCHSPFSSCCRRHPVAGGLHPGLPAEEEPLESRWSLHPGLPAAARRGAQHTAEHSARERDEDFHHLPRLREHAVSPPWRHPSPAAPARACCSPWPLRPPLVERPCLPQFWQPLTGYQHTTTHNNQPEAAHYN